MGASCAPIPGEGVTYSRRETLPLTRIAQARSDLSPPELGFTRVRHIKVAEVGYIRFRLGRGAAGRKTAYASRLRTRLSRIILGLLLCVAAAAAYALTFPELTGRVIDDAGILDAAAKAALEGKLAEFEQKTTGQLVVVTLKSLQGTSIEDYGYQLGRHWGFGQKEKNTGALLIVAPNERKVRIEVGYGFEGTLTDAVSRLIIENSILPRFRVGDFAGGIARGVDDIIQAVTVDAEEWKARAKRRPDDQPGLADLLTFLFFLVIFFIIVSRIARHGQPQAGPWGRRGRGGPIFLPMPGSWGSSGSSGGSSWGGSSGGFGGGFSGGGGSFGGGGASGSW
jgi:uncharacterized protein